MIYIFGNMVNLFCAWIFVEKVWRKNVCVFYFTICLFLNLCNLNSTILASIFLGDFNIHVENSNVIFSSMFYLSNLYFHRIFLHLSIVVNSFSKCWDSFVQFKWIVFNFHVLIKVNLCETSPSVFVCFYDDSGLYLEYFSYSSLFITILYDLLMIILTILALKNVGHIKSIPRRRQNQLRSMTKKDFQLLRCLFTQDIVYIC